MFHHSAASVAHWPLAMIKASLFKKERWDIDCPLDIQMITGSRCMTLYGRQSELAVYHVAECSTIWWFPRIGVPPNHPF